MIKNPSGDSRTLDVTDSFETLFIFSLSVHLMQYFLCPLEPVQSRQSTTVLQIPCADSWKERYVRRGEWRTHGAGWTLWPFDPVVVSSRLVHTSERGRISSYNHYALGNMSMGQSISFSVEYFAPTRWLIWEVFLQMTRLLVSCFQNAFVRSFLPFKCGEMLFFLSLLWQSGLQTVPFSPI